METKTQTEIQKRVKNYCNELGMTHDRNNNPGVVSPSSIELGANFILSMPELKEAFLSSSHILAWLRRMSCLQWDDPDYAPNFKKAADKLEADLDKLNELGVV